MYKPAKIIVALVIFAVIVSFPIWHSIGNDSTIPDVEISLDTPVINAMGDDAHCIYDADYMRANHMKILKDWKVEVVRNGNRMVVTEDGQEYLASLQNTCFECHSNYEDVCLKCHEYANVDPSCWECHVEPTVASVVSEGV